jgi:hypothetical protein
MAKPFGSKYQDLIKLNPNKKSLPNDNPGILNTPISVKNPYHNLITSGSNRKSLFNNDPGIVFVSTQTKNPYVYLINKWDFTKATPYSPYIGRNVVAPIVDSYYVVDGYVDEDYVQVQHVPAW